MMHGVKSSQVHVSGIMYARIDPSTTITCYLYEQIYINIHGLNNLSRMREFPWLAYVDEYLCNHRQSKDTRALTYTYTDQNRHLLIKLSHKLSFLRVLTSYVLFYCCCIFNRRIDTTEYSKHQMITICESSTSTLPARAK